MKKIIKLIIGIFIIVLVFELIAYFLKDSHEINYTIKDNNKNFKINEVFKNDKYYFKITTKDYKYSFEIDNDFHKKKEIITKIYSYIEDDYFCIYPAIKKTNKSNIICSKDNKSYSYTYSKDFLKPFTKSLKENGYSSPSWKKTSDAQKKIETLTAYQNNIKDKTYIYVYKYNGFFSINKESLSQVNLFKNDTYINHLGTQIDKYYIIPNYDEKYDYSKLYVINMTNDKVKERKLKQEISKDSYINGIIEDKIYLFDKDELKQYTINKNGKKVKEIGNKEKGTIYYDLEFKNEDVYTMRDEELKFKTFKDYISKIENKTTIKYLENKEDSYYYQTKNNNVYYYNINSKVKVLLFNKKISDFMLINNTLYFISEDTLYSYENTTGLKKLITYSELSFNSKNRIAIYEE